MNGYNLIPNDSNKFPQTNLTTSDPANMYSIILGPLQKYFIVKSQKEITLKRVEYAAEARNEILRTIARVASSGQHDEELYNMLMDTYNRIPF